MAFIESCSAGHEESTAELAAVRQQLAEKLPIIKARLDLNRYRLTFSELQRRLSAAEFWCQIPTGGLLLHEANSNTAWLCWIVLERGADLPAMERAMQAGIEMLLLRGRT